MSGKIFVVGVGPGGAQERTAAALTALESAKVILGYEPYLDLIRNVCPDTLREASGMGQEVRRAQRALALAKEGEVVALVSDGDAGVYGMAGLMFEILEAAGETEVAVEVVPGVSALQAAAAVLGAPLMTDFAAVSLSDALTPREDILRRVEAAVRAGFVIGLYNPSSRRRADFFAEVCALLGRLLPAKTPVGIVRNAMREGESARITDLASLPAQDVDMHCLVVIGNAQTVVWNGRMITRRGYQKKYDLGMDRTTEGAP